jgi:hypothetical protein
MNDKAWRVAAVSLLTGLMIGVPGVGQAADGEDGDPALAALFDERPPGPDQLFRVEWVASSGLSGRSRLEGSVQNGFGRTALNVQLRVSELDAAGETVSTVIGPTLERVPGQGKVRFHVQVPDHRRSYRVAVASFSLDFADPAAR